MSPLLSQLFLQKGNNLIHRVLERGFLLDLDCGLSNDTFSRAIFLLGESDTSKRVLFNPFIPVDRHFILHI